MPDSAISFPACPCSLCDPVFPPLPQVPCRHGALEAAVPAAALAFAAAAAAPGSAAAPPSGLSHGVSTGTDWDGLLWPCAAEATRVCDLLGCGLWPGVVKEGEAVLRALGTRRSCLNVPGTTALLRWGSAPWPGGRRARWPRPAPPPSFLLAPGQTWQQPRWRRAGRRPARRESQGAGSRPGRGRAALPYLDVRLQRLPLAASGGNGRAPRASILGRLTREQERRAQWPWGHVFPILSSQVELGHPASGVKG